ncbi:hypothetical protein [Aliiglaciecola litoralis]
MDFISELKRRNVFKVGIAYLVMAWIVVQVTSIAVPALHLPAWVNTLVFFFGLIGFPFALFFAWAFEITPEGVKRESNIGPEESIAAHTGRKLDFIIIGLLVLIAGYFIYESRFASPEPSSASAENQISATDTAASADASQDKKGNAVIALAVLPFVNMSNDPEQEYFVDGLTEELLNSLTRVQGLKVTGRTSSFEYKNKNIDLREIAKNLDVAYLVEGSVRKSKDDLRITVQLIESESGSHILSETFTRKLVDVFALQEDISNQVAAALNLTLVLKDERYHSALSTLDYLAVEKMVTARALINQIAEAPVLQAYNTLLELNNQYPQTPEIMGLMAYAALITAGIAEPIITLDQIIELSKQTIQLDRKNLDALSTLATIYDEYPQHYTKANDIYQAVIRFYPANASTYKAMLVFLIQMNRSCEEIQTFLNTVPAGVFSVEKQQQYKFMLSHCLTPKLAEAQLAELTDKAIADISLYYSSPTFWFEDIKKKVAKNPNQRYLTSYYNDLLIMGAKDSAQTISNKIDFNADGFWSFFASIDSYLHDIKGYKKPFDFRSTLETLFDNDSALNSAIPLAKQATTEGRTTELKSYLDKVPVFSIGVDTAYYSYGLVILQYYSGEKALSKQTAQQFFKQLQEYKSKYPESFRYWRLNSYLLPMAFFSGNDALAADILNQDFADNYEYWADDYEAVAFALHPWAEHPSVIDYLKRIKADQQHMLQKYDLR